MRQPRPPQSKKGSSFSLHEFKPEKVYLLGAKFSCKKNDGMNLAEKFQI
jgi:hypothetical protein